jgi:hypothetical protein
VRQDQEAVIRERLHDQVRHLAWFADLAWDRGLPMAELFL